MILIYISICLLLNNVYAYNCPFNKIWDTQLRSCIHKISYYTDPEAKNNLNKYLNIGYDPLLKEFTEEEYYYKINNTIKTCPKNYIFNGITCKLDEKIVVDNNQKVICNIKHVSSIDYTKIPLDICNYLIFGPFDMNDKYEITYVNFWENTTRLNEVLTNSLNYVNTESIIGVYISIGRNIEFWKNILESKEVDIIKDKLEEFAKQYKLNGLVIRYVNSTKFVELVDKLSIEFMLNINTAEISNTDEFRHIVSKAKYINVLANKEKNISSTNIVPLFEQKDIETTISNIINTNIDKNKISISYPIYGMKYEISDENAKLLYKNKNISEIKSEQVIQMFSNENSIIPMNAICNMDTKLCTKEDLQNNTVPDCIYGISDSFGSWMVYKNKLTNFIDSNTFYNINAIRNKNGINNIFIDSLDDDFGINCNDDYPSYYFSNTLVRVTHIKDKNILMKINTHDKSYFIKKNENTSDSSCLNNICKTTGFMEYKCNKQKYIKCVKIKNIFYKYIFSCRNGFVFNKNNQKCRRVKMEKLI